jgi:hypothetical protein
VNAKIRYGAYVGHSLFAVDLKAERVVNIPPDLPDTDTSGTPSASELEAKLKTLRENIVLRKEHRAMCTNEFDK